MLDVPNTGGGYQRTQRRSLRHTNGYPWDVAKQLLDHTASGALR